MQCEMNLCLLGDVCKTMPCESTITVCALISAKVNDKEICWDARCPQKGNANELRVNELPARRESSASQGEDAQKRLDKSFKELEELTVRATSNGGP
jgi:hypothetical protein